MTRLVDTERHHQHPIDRAASSILTDRSLHYARASWQQCTCCDEWIEENKIEYTFTCTLGSGPSGSPTPTFQLKTRWPAYTCPRCVGAPHKDASTPAGESSDDEGEAEQLCPLHVQAVYTLQGSATADNMGAIAKGFLVHCPDCQYVSRLLKTPVSVCIFIEQHLQSSSTCIKLKQALTAGTYDSPAAFGASSNSSKVQPEKVILELMSRLVVMTACHIASATRPPLTPLDQLHGEARRITAATAHIRSSSKGESTAECQQLLPYRAWAVDALSLDSELLTEANWVRPSLAGLALEHKPSLLDLVLAPPYIAVAEHDAGMTVDKLAVLLLREQQRQNSSSLHRLASAVAAGEGQLVAAVAAVEAAVSDLLAADAVFQHIPVQQRVQQFLDLSGIPSLGDIVCALAQPHVAGRGPHHGHLAVCAVCGMTPAALQRGKRSYALHRCKYCIVTTCQSCKQEQEEEQGGSPIEAAAAEQLCLWCQGHPDTHDLDVGTTSSGSGNSKAKQQQQQQQHLHSLSSSEHSVDQATAAAAAVLWSVKRSSDNSMGTQQQHQPQEQPSVGREVSGAAAVAAAANGDTTVDHKSAHDYDLVVQMAAAASALHDDQDSQLVVAANSKLQQEMENLQRLQAELQSAAEHLGIQGLQLIPPPLAAAATMQQQDSTSSKHRPPAGDPDAALLATKRQKTVPSTAQSTWPVAVPQATNASSSTADSALADLLLSSAGFTPINGVAAAADISKGQAHAAAAIKQESDAVHMLVDAGFTTVSSGEAPAGSPVAVNAALIAENAKQPQQQGASKSAEAVDPRELSESVDQCIAVLSADINGWCLSNLAADHADVQKTLEIIQQLKQQLWHNYQQTGQQLFLHGLEILGEIVGAFIALPDAGCKVVLACNSQRWVPAACCPDDQPCSVLELIMCCWFQEVQDSGVGTAAPDCTAAGGSPRFDHVEQQQIIRSGQCHIVLRLIAQLSALQYQVYYGLLAAGAELQQIQGQKEVAAALRDAVIHVVSGTALLMLHRPEAGSTNKHNSKAWGQLAANWQQCLLQCKWAVANKCGEASSTALVLAGAVRELERLASDLLILKQAKAL